MKVEARLFCVRGRVQGVGFRYFVMHVASRLGLTGWVRNHPDGSVEVLAQGTPDALDDLGSHLQEGPPVSRVASVESASVTPDLSLREFGVSR